MKVILRQEVPSLGTLGDIVTVKNGYARNYLIPQGLAYVATDKSIRTLEVEKKKFDIFMAKEKESAEAMAEKLTEQQVSIAMKVGEEDKLYGSVSPQMIAQELSLRGFEIDKRNIIIEDPIKSLGVFDVKCKLHPEVTTTLKVWVISED